MIKYNNPLFMNLGGSSDSSSISNIKTAMVLFQSTSSDGTHSTIELNDDVSNYDYIGIYFKADNTVISGYTEVDAKDNSQVCLSLTYPTMVDPSSPTSDYYGFTMKSAYVRIEDDNKTINFKRNASINIDKETGIARFTTNEVVNIYKVVGYKILDRGDDEYKRLYEELELETDTANDELEARLNGN